MPIDKIAKRSTAPAVKKYPNAAPFYYDTVNDEIVFYDENGTTQRVLLTKDQSQALSNKTLANTVLSGDKSVTRWGVLALAGAAIHAAGGGVIAWQNPEGAAIIILRALLDITTVATAAATLDVGTTATDATTTSDNLIDGKDVNAATGLFDNITDAGTNGKARQKLASGKWVTVDEKTGDATGLVGNLYIEYILA